MKKKGSPTKNKELKPEPLNDGSDFGDEVDHSRPGDFSQSGAPGAIKKNKTDFPSPAGKNKESVEIDNLD